MGGKKMEVRQVRAQPPEHRDASKDGSGGTGFKGGRGKFLWRCGEQARNRGNPLCAVLASGGEIAWR